MNRNEFVIVATIVLMLAFGFGWFANWLVHRFRRIPADGISQLERMAKELHEAEDARDQALMQLEESDRKWHSKLKQTTAELNATMDGLRTARLEIDALKKKSSE